MRILILVIAIMLVALRSPAPSSGGSGGGGSGTTIIGITNELDGKSLYGQPWAAMQRPWALLYTAPYIVGINPPEGESYLTNFIVNLSTNGFLAAVTNKVQLAVFMDEGWSVIRMKATNWAYITNNYGTLTVNSNLFPSGIPWLASFLHGYNINLMVQMYGATNVIPLGADELITTAGGQSIQPWTNGVGTIPTNFNGTYVTAIGLDTAAQDASQMLHWGIDGIFMADGTPSDYQVFDAVFGPACLNIRVPLTTVGQFASYPAIFQIGKVLAYLPYQGPNGDQRYTMGFQNIGAHSGYAYDNEGQFQGGDGSAFRRFIRDFPTTTAANQGAYVRCMGYTGLGDRTFTALTHAIIGSGGPNDTILSSSWSGFTNSLLNTNWVNVWQDRAQSTPFLVTNAAPFGGLYPFSVWATKLYDGSFAVGLLNETNSTVNPVFSWTALGIDTNLYCNVKSILAAPFTDYGSKQGTYTEALTSQSSELLIVRPKVALQDAGNFTLTQTTVAGDGQGSVIRITRGQTVTYGAMDSNTVIFATGGGIFSGFTIESIIHLAVDNSTAFGGCLFSAYNAVDGTQAHAGLGVKEGSGMVPEFDVSVSMATAWKGFTASNGISSYASNTLALTSFTFPATTINWTNTTARNIDVYIDNTGVTGTAVKLNGSTIFTGISLDVTISSLQPGEYFSETYTVGTPNAKYKPQ